MVFTLKIERDEVTASQDKRLLRFVMVNFQVTADGRWGEVALALKLDGETVQDPQPLLKLYALFLYQYEQLYYYREPRVKAASTLGTIARDNLLEKCIFSIGFAFNYLPGRKSF